jgi:Ca-activated chloride channel homolog
VTGFLRYFARPWALTLAVLLPALAIVLLGVWHRRRAARLARLGTPSMVSRLVPAASLAPSRTRTALVALATALAGAALAGPRWGLERTIVRGQGIDLVLALDASLSMMATDERPSRLDRVKQEVRRLRASSSGDRVALLAFAGRSYILTPMTVDDGALDLFLDNLDPSVVGQAGSSLARAIRQGTDLLLMSKAPGDRAIVVMSDGEAFEPEEDVVAEAARAAESGISLVTVGFGTPQGASIPVRTEAGLSLKRDENGDVVVTRYHPDLLRAAATAARGTFVDAAETDKAGKVRRALSQLRATRRSVDSGRDLTPRYQLFLLPALLLLLLDTFLGERRGRRGRRGAAASAAPAAAAILIAALLTLTPRAARANDLEDAARLYRAKQYARAAALYRAAVAKGDQSPATLYNLGTALLAADSIASASEALERAATTPDPELRFRALFNLGLAHLRRGLAERGEAGRPALDAALAAYKKALLLRATDADAKWNYELALREKKSGGGGGGGSNDNAPQAPQPSAPQAPAQQPSGSLGQQRAEELLNSAARDERDVQGKKQKQNRATPPPGGTDW